jgi:hypothetical protein
MARTGRAYPSHVISKKAGLASYIVTLNVVSPTSLSMLKAKVVTLSVVSATVDGLTAIKLKSLTTLSVASATVNSIATKSGKGMILSVTSATTSTMIRAVGKGIIVVSPTAIALIKGIGKVLGTTLLLTPKYVLRSRLVVNNFDGGLSSPLSATVLPEQTIPTLQPGLFRVSPPKSTIKVQFREFITSVFKRVGVS